MVSWLTICIIAMILVTLDKGLTVLNILSVGRNNPGTDPYLIEKNPLARASFQKFGLIGGTLIYWVFSVGTFLLAIYLFSIPAKAYAPNNALGVSLYVMMIFYSFTIGNNVYFALKYNGVI